MLLIDVNFCLDGGNFEFKAEIPRGKVHTFTVGEPILRGKLFWVLCGLDKNYNGTISGEGICFNASCWNNVLALGDKTMFIRGTVRRNIYKALRFRADRKTAKIRTEEVIKIYGLEVLAGLKIDYLEDAELLKVSLARAHYRPVGLVIAKKCEIDFAKWPDAYIIVID